MLEPRTPEPHEFMDTPTLAEFHQGHGNPVKLLNADNRKRYDQAMADFKKVVRSRAKELAAPPGTRTSWGDIR